VRKIVTDASVSINKDSATSAGLLQRAALRQADAWDKLVSLYGPLVYRWCRLWGLQPKDAENVGQEVFLRVLQGLPEFQRAQDKHTFRGWLFRISRNCFVDHIRQHQSVVQGTGGSDARASLEQFPSNAEDESATAREDEGIVFQQAVELIRGEFSERDWELFSQVVLQGRTAADVAADLNINTNVAYLVKSRVLRRLREEFEDLVEF
jgi:RNA polymerase sigma-70 factor, ECF subfamily